MVDYFLTNKDTNHENFKFFLKKDLISGDIYISAYKEGSKIVI